MKKLSFLPLLVVALFASAQDADWNKVKYNNPGLTVDLEEGLWPIPIPVDNDNDGLTDLFVTETSLPNKGLYYYHNIGTAKNPLFDKPVRVSSANDSIYPSYVNGKLRVLQRGQELLNFTKEFYSHPDTIIVENNDITKNKNYRKNEWSYVDYDGDGDYDIIVGIDDWKDYGWDNAFDSKGHWTRGPLHGYVYLIENVDNHYINRGKLSAGGKDIDVFGYSSPMFADFDGDGDLDLICGEFVDKMTWFENIGTRTKPLYKAGKFLTCDKDTLRATLEMIVPVAFDFDKDGQMDILCGEEDGRIAFYRNSGPGDGMPRFEKPVYLQQVASDLKFGALATPYSVDWDGDGDEDLISGNSAGFLSFIENLSGGETPKWNKPALLKADGKTIHIVAGENGSIQGPAEAKWGYTVPVVVDWDGDGRKDILVNSIWGEVLWYRNKGSLTDLEGPFKMKVAWEGETPKPAWNWWTPEKNTFVTQWRTVPFAIDWNHDGLQDLVMLDQEGYLAFFERFRKGNELWLKPGQRIFDEQVGDSIVTLRLSDKKAGGSGRRKFCFTDWDGDGDLDLMLNTSNVTFMENIGLRNGRVCFLKHDNIGKRRLSGHSNCPTPVDWNHDGKPDILTGAEDGHFYLFMNPRK